MAVLPSGLQINRSLGRSTAPSLQFEPSLGFMAARVMKLSVDIRSFREPLKRSIQKVMIPSFAMNFFKQGRPKRWVPLAQGTIDHKYGDPTPLVDSGLLKKTVKQLNIWTLTSDRAYIADLPQSIFYGKINQMGYGGQAVKVKSIGTGAASQASTVDAGPLEGGLPARPFIVMQDQDIQDIEKIFTDWIGERVLASGFVGTHGTS